MSCYIKTCEESVRAGGRVLLEMLGRVTVREKAPADLVTEADLASQNVVSRIILEAFPDHRVLGEEQTDAAAGQKDAEFCWIVDPLDGTTNFVHGVPHFSVSLALRHRNTLLVGVVFNPIADEMYSATAGGGAFLNGQPIHVSPVSTMSDALAGIGFPPRADRGCADVQAFLRAIPVFQAIRRTGSAALNLAYVAAGRFDASWSFSTRIWDMAAGALLVREAGGMVTSPDGGEILPETSYYLAAATPELHAKILADITTPTVKGV
jgi:myo-inositol-1(or 4)-monophosphatase